MEDHYFRIKHSFNLDEAYILFQRSNYPKYSNKECPNREFLAKAFRE